MWDLIYRPRCQSIVDPVSVCVFSVPDCCCFSSTYSSAFLRDIFWVWPLTITGSYAGDGQDDKQGDPPPAPNLCLPRTWLICLGVRGPWICVFLAPRDGDIITGFICDSHDTDRVAQHRYNVGVLSSVLVHPGFVKQLHHPSASKKGLITAIYYLGTWISYVFLSHPASDRLGRRYAALVGTVITCFGSALQAGAKGSGAYAMVISGRIIAGIGVAIVSTSVPLYQRYACNLKPI